MESHLHDQFKRSEIKSQNCYGMLQVGLEVQFYKYENSHFSRFEGRMHLINDANNVVVCGRHIKQNPLPFIKASR